MISIKSDVNDLLQVFAAYGLATILEDFSDNCAELWWDSDGMVNISCGGISLKQASKAIKEYAESSAASPWLTARSLLSGSKRATLSPRVGRLSDTDSHRVFQSDRRSVIDEIAVTDRAAWHLVGALGEPSYWWVLNDPTNPDYGASPWEMKTRNRGEEFIQNRLSLLAQRVAERTVEEIESGLDGRTAIDEAGKNLLNSRTPTGLRAPGPTDNAVAWCALIGLGLMPVRPVAPSTRSPRPRSIAAGVAQLKLGLDFITWFIVPIPTQPITLSRLRTVVRSEALAQFARGAIALLHADDGREMLGGHEGAEWLTDHGIGGVTVARKHFTDNPNAPESWAVPIGFEATQGLDYRIGQP